MVNTSRVRLLPQSVDHYRALMEGQRVYEQKYGARMAEGLRDMFCGPEVSAEFHARLADPNSRDDIWRDGFMLLEVAENLIIGSCGFVGPPNREGWVEMAYGIAPAFQGRGYATEAARLLMAEALKDARVREVRAHTLPGPNASTSVLTKCGFVKKDEIVDPVDGAIWRWERKREGA
jgi:[ribosomal protein S5]-alanine N-acetyltransferase